MNFSLKRPILKTVSEIAEVSGFLWNKGWAERNAGNISVDVTGDLPFLAKKFIPPVKIKLKIPGPILGGRCLLVTATGARMRNIARVPDKNLLLVEISKELNGYNILWGDAGLRPTSEFISHLKIHAHLINNKPGHYAIVHSHPLYLTALSLIPDFSNEEEFNKILFSMHPEIKIFMPEGVGFVEYCCPGSDALARATAESMSEHRLVIWEKHGVISAGQNVYDAFDLIDIADKAAKIFITCRQTGHKPKGLTAKQQAEIEKHFPGL